MSSYNASQHQSGLTLDQLVKSSNEYTASVRSLASTGTFSPSENVSYEKLVWEWDNLEPALRPLYQQGGNVPQAVRTASDSGKTARIMSAYTLLGRCETPYQGVIIRQQSAGYEKVTYGDGNPSKLNSEQMDRLKQATSVAGYEEVYGKPYRAVHDWILRNETTTAK